MTGCTSIIDFKSFVDCLGSGIITPLIYLFFALALVYFLMGMVKYVSKGADEDDRRAGRSMMVYGIIALAVMVSVWGLVNLVTGSIGLDNSQPYVPQMH